MISMAASGRRVRPAPKRILMVDAIDQERSSVVAERPAASDWLPPFESGAPLAVVMETRH